MGPPGPPKYEKKYFCHIFYQIASLFDMYIDMVERMAGKQNRPSLNIEDPLTAPRNSQKYTFLLHIGPYMKNWFSNGFLLYICLPCDEVCIC